MRARPEFYSDDRVMRWLFVAPLAALLLCFMVFPTLYSLWMSFTDYTMRGSPEFIGLDNYRYLLADAEFWSALRRTVFVMVVSIAAELTAGMALALLLNREFRGQNVLRGLCFAPLLVSPLAMSLMWKYILDVEYGVVNHTLAALGGSARPWFADGDYALWTVILISVWQWLPFSTFVLLAGLRGLPRDQFESARVDGASSARVFFRLTLPMLRPLILIIVLLRTMWLMRLFDPLYGTTRGGVDTELLDWLVYRVSFVLFDVGLGSAYAMFSLYITLIVCALLFKRLVAAMGRG